MHVYKSHAEATCRHCELKLVDYWLLLVNVIETRFLDYKSLTVNLPYEIQHPHIYNNLSLGKGYLWWGEFLKRVFFINLYWRNAPALKTNGWALKYGNTTWTYIPTGIDLCLDTGHLMLGLGSDLKAKERIQAAINIRGKQIKHLHLSENNRLSDQHLPPKRFKQFFLSFIKGRTYVSY